MRKILLAAFMAASALVPAATFAQSEEREHGRWRQQAPAEGGAPPESRARPDGLRQFQQPQPQPEMRRFDAQGGQPEFRRFDRGQAMPGQLQSQPEQGRRGDWQNRNGGGWNGQPQVPAIAQPQPAPQSRGDWQGRRGDGWVGRDRQQQSPVILQQPQQQPGWRDGRRDGGFEQRSDGRQEWRQQGWRDGDRRDGDRRNGDWRGNDWRGHNNAQQRFDHRGGGGWNRNWRNDGRYDWNRSRRYNRENFHLPRYYAPYGWDYGYRRFSIGFRLSSILFGQNYWIDDPYYYDLPPAYGPYRWVRYYNDALLVDIYTGEVVDTVYDIFW